MIITVMGPPEAVDRDVVYIDFFVRFRLWANGRAGGRSVGQAAGGRRVGGRAIAEKRGGRTLLGVAPTRRRAASQHSADPLP